MNKNRYITIIDITEGVAGKYAVRVGAQYSPSLRLVNCCDFVRGKLIRAMGDKYTPGDTYTPIFDFDTALGAAKSLQEQHPMYVVRVDCTIG
jgi:hypothetical protein